jgi:hypothetical protein
MTDTTNIKDLMKGVDEAKLNGGLDLPSRDIPISSANVVIDDKTQVNYIGDATKYLIEKPAYIKKQRMHMTLYDIYDEFNGVVLLSLLYYTFNMPVLKSYIFKNITCLFKSDGNYNTIGMIIMSIMFGALYYVLSKVVGSDVFSGSIT